MQVPKCFLILAAICLTIFAAPPVRAAIAPEDVYFGDARHFSKAVEINARKVFMAIPAYRDIIEKDIPKDSALYLAKLSRANKCFLKAVTAYAEANYVDLVCEEGRISGASNATGEIVRIVKELIEKK